MPRANRYFVEGKLYHLTHRCHNRQFLFKFARDRDDYRQRLWEALHRFPITLFSYCLTSNHVHLLVQAERTDTISQWMKQLDGEFAQAYNRRKKRSGALWEDRYHSTMIDRGAHLLRCMVYIELNMVRAGVVRHPSEWAWCSYAEWMGVRKRYRLVHAEECLSVLGGIGLKEFREQYQHSIQESLAKGELARQPHWTESIAVGAADFVSGIAGAIRWRQSLEQRRIAADAWILRDERTPTFLENNNTGEKSPLSPKNQAKFISRCSSGAGYRGPTPLAK